jgi:hypothetical protein
MSRILVSLTLLCASLSVQISTSYAASPDDRQQSSDTSSGQSVVPVVQWNKNLLTIVRTAGAQPATVHPTRSFAIMHAAIYDAVNAIDGRHEPYLVQLRSVSKPASQEAAAAAAAHEVLVTLYPKFQPMLDSDLQQSLAQIPDGPVRIMASASERMLPIRCWRCEAMTAPT